MDSEELNDVEEAELEVDPINDIIDYLVRCAKISFKNAHVNESEIRTKDKIKLACDLYEKSPTEFLLQFGRYLAPHHVGYFENLLSSLHDARFCEVVNELKIYHSDKSTRKRARNRRYNALKKLQSETDYFSEKQMMYRNPLLYEQLIGQYLTDEEIKERDGVDNDNLTFLSMILETVDRNEMREMKNEQMLEEDLELDKISNTDKNSRNDDEDHRPKIKKQWGDFDTPDTRPSYMPEPRKQSMITAPERNLLRQEFVQEMISSFIEGRDTEVDYHNIDNNELYDDLQQVSQDAEDRYFDSETNDIENLEEHMKLVQEYGRKNSNSNVNDDPLEVFMKHISNKLEINYFCSSFF